MMEHDYLEWINKSYQMLIQNQEIPKLEYKIPDGKISIYRVVNIIRCDINREETKLRQEAK